MIEARCVAELEFMGLDLDEMGVPTTPLIVLPLEEWSVAGRAEVESAAEIVQRALPVTVGVARKPPPDHLRPLLDALTLTLVPVGIPQPDLALIEVPDVASASASVSAAVTRCPQASVALNRLLRQTSRLGTAEGLAAEAAVYSMLLGGGEFARWLAGRGAPRPRLDSGRPPIRLLRDGTRLSIVLDRAERRNALSVELRQALTEALDLATLDTGIEQVELSGAGPVFCSGGDLDEFGNARDLVAAYLVRLECAPWRLIDRMRDRIAVRVHGACVGAGIEMAAFAGTVSAEPDSFFLLPEIGMGLVPGAGGTVGVTRRIGRWRAAWMMLTGARVGSATAVRWGLVDELTGT